MSRPLAFVLLLGLVPFASADDKDKKKDKPKATTLAEDLVKLEGTWKTDAKANPRWAVEMVFSGKTPRIFIDITGKFRLKGEEQEELGITSPIKLTEVKKTRRIETTNDITQQVGLGSVLPYKIDGDTLHLTVLEGGLKGEYKLTRVKEKPKDKPKEKAKEKKGK